jgi:tetratricopeptide (TPR) repeat protein
MNNLMSTAEIETRLEKAKAEHRRGNLTDSVPVYQQILETDPKHPEALHLLGVAMMQVGRLNESLTLLTNAVKVAPNNVRAHNNFGAALLAAKKLPEAAQHFAKAAELDESFDEAQYNLGRALHELGNSQEALARYRRAIELNPNHASAANNLGALLVLSGHLNEGLSYLRRAMELAPKSGKVLSNAVYALERTNNLEEAARYSEELVRIAPDLPMAKILQARIARRNGDLATARYLLNEVAQSEAPPALKVDAYFELSKVLDAKGEYAEAFRNCTKAKQLRATLPDAANWDRTGYYEAAAAHRAWTTADRIRSTSQLPDGPRNPVFFVGFPRSGTTLLEQVLDAHPDLVTTGERTPLNLMINSADRLIGRQLTFPEDIESINEDEILKLRQGFFQAARNVTGDELVQRRLVDKMPLNIVKLGLVNRIFPDAKVLVALRDPRDTCLSCYFQQFRPNRAMLNFLELATTGEFYATVMGLWLHYRSVLSVPWMEYRYEILVEDFENTVREVLDFIGVPWDEAVTGYADYARSKNINTPSYSDVVSGISKSAIGRWRHYRDELTPILPILEPFVKEFGYEPS